ncbi:MAG TPA: putative metallopeptidase [Pyrinomonadaceae bacterium]|nr:putative metallopeptidase [Pyrinomonadaceae bacterium]
MSTFEARYISEAPHINFSAVLDHELYHCAHKLDECGQKEYSKTTGKPKFAILGHDVEEFEGIWRRYGVRAGAGESMKLFASGKGKPSIGKADIQKLCGNC